MLSIKIVLNKGNKKHYSLIKVAKQKRNLKEI